MMSLLQSYRLLTVSILRLVLLLCLSLLTTGANLHVLLLPVSLSPVFCLQTVFVLLAALWQTDA